MTFFSRQSAQNAGGEQSPYSPTRVASVRHATQAHDSHSADSNTDRRCATCGDPVPAKKPRPSKSTGKRPSTPKNRPVRCLACRGVMTPCPVCGEPFSKSSRSGDSCSPSCGAIQASQTRRARGDFGPRQEKGDDWAAHCRRHGLVHKPRAPKSQPAVEWRGSAIDKVRAIRGSM